MIRVLIAIHFVTQTVYWGEWCFVKFLYDRKYAAKRYELIGLYLYFCHVI